MICGLLPNCLEFRDARSRYAPNPLLVESDLTQATPCAYFLRIAWCIDCYALDANPEFGFDAPEVRRSFVSKAANGVTIENAGIALPNWRLCRSTPKRKRLQSDAAKSTHDDWKALPFGER